VLSTERAGRTLYALRPMFTDAAIRCRRAGIILTPIYAVVLTAWLLVRRGLRAATTVVQHGPDGEQADGQECVEDALICRYDRSKLSQMIRPRSRTYPWPNMQAIKAPLTPTTASTAAVFRPQLCCSLGTAHLARSDRSDRLTRLRRTVNINRVRSSMATRSDFVVRARGLGLRCRAVHDGKRSKAAGEQGGANAPHAEG